MSYLFTTPAQQQEMLDAIGAPSIDSLFDPIPNELRLKRDLNLPAPLTELELEAEDDPSISREITAKVMMPLGIGNR